MSRSPVGCSSATRHSRGPAYQARSRSVVPNSPATSRIAGTSGIWILPSVLTYPWYGWPAGGQNPLPELVGIHVQPRPHREPNERRQQAQQHHGSGDHQPSPTCLPAHDTHPPAYFDTGRSPTRMSGAGGRSVHCLDRTVALGRAWPQARLFPDAAELRPIGTIVRGRARLASTGEHRPADVVAQPLVIKYELADRLRELIALPLALKSPCGLAQAFRGRRTCSLDRVGGRAELVRGNVGDGSGLAGGVRGMPCCPRRFLAAAIAWPPAARACVILTSPRTQARARSIA